MPDVPAWFVPIKNALQSDGGIIVLVEIDYEDTNPLRVADWDENVEWPEGSGRIWLAAPLKLGKIRRTGTRSETGLQAEVENASRAIESYLEEADGGVGAEVILYAVHSQNLDREDPVFEERYENLETATDSEWAVFDLGSEDLMGQDISQQLSRNFCRFTRPEQCEHVAECDHTKASCRKFWDEASQWGGA